MAAGASIWSIAQKAITAASAGTAKTVLLTTAGSNQGFKLSEVGIGFIGASGTAKPVQIELVNFSAAGAGTSAGSVTPVLTEQFVTTAQEAATMTAAYGYTAEPTTLTPIRVWRIHPQAGLVVQFPLGREPFAHKTQGIGLRVTFESGETTTNIDAYMEVEQ